MVPPLSAPDPRRLLGTLRTLQSLRALPASAWVGLPFALALGVACAVGAAAAPSATEDAPAVTVEPLTHAAQRNASPPMHVSSDTLRAGETLEILLGAHGLSHAEIANLAELMRPVVPPRTLRPGAELEVRRPATGGLPDRLRLKTDADRILEFSTAGARWRLRIDSVPVTVDTVVVAGAVASNLYTAELHGDADRMSPREQGLLAHRLSRVFAWQVDFYRDVRRGDAFRVVLERDVRPDGSVREARVLAAEFRNRGRRLSAIRFRPDEEVGGFYDVEGQALRGAFLRAPLEFGRVTSGFTRRRYHPVLRRWRAHLGTDYGARTGTPVLATGDGSVARAGWWGGYGLMVELRHDHGYRTRYAHLSALGSGVRRGARVSQGQVIGRVGSTGLSTGSHLHYEFLKNGRPTDPARVDLPRVVMLDDGDLPAFRRAREDVMALVRRVPWPGSPAPAPTIVAADGED